MIKNKGISRKDFIFSILSPFLLSAYRYKKENFLKKQKTNIIRPPAALKEEQFLNKCIRCGNCLKSCITNALHPTFFESGIKGIWTPHLVPEIGYCDFECNLCGNVCPTGAIPSLPLKKKQRIKLGIAKIEITLCIAFTKNVECITCQENCPVPYKAIVLREKKAVLIDEVPIYQPYVVKKFCIGCGACQLNCPVRPVRAIRVESEFADRTV